MQKLLLMQVEALWESMSRGGGGKQKQGLEDPESTAVGEPQGSKPAAGINWGSLCRPIRKAAAPEDMNRVCSYAQADLFLL